jgi:hypothetical protein
MGEVVKSLEESLKKWQSIGKKTKEIAKELKKTA